MEEEKRRSCRYSLPEARGERETTVADLEYNVVGVGDYVGSLLSSPRLSLLLRTRQSPSLPAHLPLFPFSLRRQSGGGRKQKRAALPFYPLPCKFPPKGSLLLPTYGQD